MREGRDYNTCEFEKHAYNIGNDGKRIPQVAESTLDSYTCKTKPSHAIAMKDINQSNFRNWHHMIHIKHPKKHENRAACIGFNRHRGKDHMKKTHS